VVKPGDYILPAGSTVADALAAAGGTTAAAYLYATEFTRESVRNTQQLNFDRALRDLDIELAKGQAGRRSSSLEDMSSLSLNAAANSRLIERMRQVRPTGRIVLQIAPGAKELPVMAVEDGDRLYIPAQSTSVGVFGSVFNSGSFVYNGDKSVEQYLMLAGGPTRGADRDSIFVIRPNGAVVSARQSAGFWGKSSSFFGLNSLPGDTIFVPEEMDKSSFVQDAKDWTQILYQFGLGVAGIKALGL
jgi:protein involved in polysaccharide export with SLBB domain